MPLVKAIDEIPNRRVEDVLPSGFKRWRTRFFWPSAEDKTLDSNMAFIIEGSKDYVLGTHYHHTHQFQIIVVGDGTLGKHNLKFGDVHFARAYTPYGPILHGENGLGFMTLRPHRDTAGAQRLPKCREALEKIPNRQPWQVSARPDFSAIPGDSGVALKLIDGLKDDRGMAGFSLVMKPGARTTAPDPSKGDGQHIVVLKGSVMHEGQEKKGLTVVFVAKGEGAFQLEAGPQGCEALVLNYPDPAPVEQQRGSPGSAGDFKTHQCVLCAFAYDEAKGMPEQGIAAGTRWADVPEDFECPDCAANKTDFEELQF